MPGYSHGPCKELTFDTVQALIPTLPEDLESESDPVLIKREDRRWVFRAPADFYYKDEEGLEQRMYASIRDISPTGIGLLVKKPVQPDTAGVVVFELQDGYHQSKVRVIHCTQTVGGFKLGCSFMYAKPPACTADGAVGGYEQM